MNIVFLLGGFLTFVLAALILVRNKRTLFWTAFIVVFIPIDYIKRFYFEVPSILRWLPMITIVGFAIMVMLLMPRTKAKIPRGMGLSYLAILLLSILSTMATPEAGIGATVVAQRGVMMIFGFIVLLKTIYHRYDKDELFSFVVKAGLASMVVAVWQRFYYVVLQGFTGDRVTGLFSVDGIFVFFQLFCIVVTMVYWLHEREIIPGYSNNLVLGGLMVSIVVCNDKAAIIYLVVLILYVASTVGFKVVWKNFGKLFLGFAALGVILLIFSLVYNSGYESQGSSSDSLTTYIEDPDAIRKYLFGGDKMYQKFTPAGQLLRGASVEFAWNLVVEDTYSFLIGLGPGSTQHSNLAGSGGWLDHKYPFYTIGRVPLGMFLAELGVIGLILQIVFLLSIYFWKPRNPAADRPGYGLIRRAFVVLALMYYIYENLYFDPIYALVIAVVVFPNPLGIRRYYEGLWAQQQAEAAAAAEEAPALPPVTV